MLVRVIVFLFLLELQPFCLFSQTFTNGDFETPNQDPTLPIVKSQMDKAIPWKAAKDDPLTPGPQSPDWLSTCSSGHVRILEEDLLNPPTTPITFINVLANTGCRYGGMLAAELIQQNIQDQLTDEAQSVHVEMFIRLLGTWRFSDDLPGVGRVPQFDSGLVLNCYMSDKKIQYENIGAACSAPDDGGYKKVDDLVLRDTRTLSVAQYPLGAWHKITMDFVAPSKNHNWIGFELRLPSLALCNLDYLLIDDVTVTVTDCSACSDCTAYDGCINFNTINNPHGVDNPFTIGGLSNVDYVKLEIYTVMGIKIRTIEIDDSPQLVSWDGKNDAGTEMPAGTYFYDIEVINSCQRIKDWFYFNNGGHNKFTKSNSSGEATVFNAYTMNYTSPGILTQDIRDHCCYDCIEITANNIGYLNPPTGPTAALALLPGTPTGISGPLEIIAINKINVDAGIVFISPGQILLQAGVEINFDHEGGGILAGAEVLCKIDDCVPGFAGDPPANLTVNNNQLYGLARSKTETVRDSIFGLENIGNETVVTMEKRIDIYPNPSYDGIFNVDIVGFYEGNIVLSVHDAKGLHVYNATFQGNEEQQVIDISSLPKGIYYVTVSSGEDHQIRKIIKY